MEQPGGRATAPIADEESRAGLLARSGLLSPAADPEIDRWTAVLREASGASVVAVAVEVQSRTLIKGLWSGDASEAETTELPASKSVEAFVTARLGDGPAPHPYLESPVVVDGHHLCTLCIANPAPRPWGARELQALENATAPMVLEMRLRLANHDAARFHELVASHNRVHELIAVGAPLREVLVELVEGIERHDPSVIASVVLLDREASALRPLAAPSLPPTTSLRSTGS